MLAVADIEQLPVEQARNGDPGAWDTLFHRFQMPLYVYAYELLRDEQTILDVVQDAAGFEQLTDPSASGPYPLV